MVKLTFLKNGSRHSIRAHSCGFDGFYQLIGHGAGKNNWKLIGVGFRV